MLALERPRGLLVVLWACVVLVNTAEAQEDLVPVDQWPSLPSLEELRSSAEAESEVVSLNGEEAMIDITPRKGQSGQATMQMVDVSSPKASPQDDDYQWGLEHAEEMETDSDSSAGQWTKTGTTSSAAARIEADAEELADAEPLLPHAVPSSEGVSPSVQADASASADLPSANDFDSAEIEQQQKAALEQVEKITKGEGAGEDSLGFLGGDVEKQLKDLEQMTMETEASGTDIDDELDIAPKAAKVIKSKKVKVARAAVHKGRMGESLKKDSKAPAEKSLGQDVDTATDDPDIDEIESATNDLDAEADKLLSAEDEDNLDTLTKGDKEQEDIEKEMEDKVANAANDLAFSGLNPDAAAEPARAEEPAVAQAAEDVPELTATDKESQAVLDQLTAKTEQIKDNVDKMYTKDREEARGYLVEKHAQLHTELHGLLHQRVKEKTAAVAKKRAFKDKLEVEKGDLENRLDAAHSSEAASKVEVARLKAKTRQMVLQNEASKKRVQSTKTEELLVGKINSLEDTVASLQRGGGGDDNHARSLEQRMNQLERRIARLATKKDDTINAGAAADTQSLQTLSHTLNDAMKLARGNDATQKLQLPDEFHQLELAKQKQRLITMKNNLEEEIYALKHKHDFMKLRVNAEKNAAEKQASLMLEVQKDKLERGVNAQKHALELSAQKKITKIESAIETTKLAAEKKAQKLEDTADEDQLEYEKAKTEMEVLQKTDEENTRLIQSAKKQSLERKERDDDQLMVGEKTAQQLAERLEETKDEVESEKSKEAQALNQDQAAAAEAESAKELLARTEKALHLAAEQEKATLKRKETEEETIARLHAKLKLLKKQSESAKLSEAEAAQLTKVIEETKAKIMGDLSGLTAEKAANAEKKNEMKQSIEAAKDAKQRAMSKLGDAEAEIANQLAEAKEKNDDAIAAAKSDADMKLSTVNAKLEGLRERFRIEVKVTKEDLDDATAEADKAEKEAKERKAEEARKLEVEGQNGVDQASEKGAAEHATLVQQVTTASLRAHQVMKQARQVLKDSNNRAFEKIQVAKAEAAHKLESANQECLTETTKAETSWQQKLREATQTRVDTQKAVASARERTARVEQAAMAAAEQSASSEIQAINNQAAQDEKSALHLATNDTNSTLGRELAHEHDAEAQARAAEAALRHAEKQLTDGRINATALVATLKAQVLQYAEIEKQSAIQKEALSAKIEQVNTEIEQKKAEFDQKTAEAEAAKAETPEHERVAAEISARRDSLKKDMVDAAKEKGKAEMKLEAIQQSNADLREKVENLEGSLKAIGNEKADLDAATAAARHNVTESKVTVQDAKVEVTRAQKAYAGRKAEYLLKEAQRHQSEAETAEAAEADVTDVTSESDPTRAI